MLITLNTIYSLEEYEKQGFTKEESPLAREYDVLHNMAVLGKCTSMEHYEKTKTRMYELIDILGL